MKRRTPETRAASSHAVLLAAEYLEHPSMVVLPGRDHPRNVARALYLVEQRLSAPDPVKNRREVMNDLQVAADYLSHKDVTSLPFAVNTLNVARALREVIRDLK
jgi:hypothetical protein